MNGWMVGTWVDAGKCACLVRGVDRMWFVVLCEVRSDRRGKAVGRLFSQILSFHCIKKNNPVPCGVSTLYIYIDFLCSYSCSAGTVAAAVTVAIVCLCASFPIMWLLTLPVCLKRTLS